MSLFELSSRVIEDLPLMACVFGLTRKGKSTCFGTIGKPTLYLYSQFEEHGFRTASKMNQETYPDNPFFGVNVSIVEPLDIKIDTFKDVPKKGGLKIPEVGEMLDCNLMVYKVAFYLKNVPESTEAVVFDGLTDYFSVLKNTDIFVRYATVRGSDGNMKYSNFQERAAYVKMFQDLMMSFKKLQDKGIDTFTTISAKAKYNEEGEIVQLLPELPMYGVVEEVLKAIPDVLPIDSAIIDGVEHRVFAMNLCVGKTQLTKTNETKAKIYTQGRLNSLLATISLGMDIQYLPVDLHNLKKNLKFLREQQGL